MLGVNDVTTEVFTLADAQAVEDYARAKGVGMSPCGRSPATPPDSWACPPIRTRNEATPQAASRRSSTTTARSTRSPTQPAAGTTVSTTPVTGGTTTSIGWHWGTNTALSFNTSKDKLDFGWMQPTNFDISEKSGSTVITIVNNNQTYTLTGCRSGRSRWATSPLWIPPRSLAQAAITASRV